ncbi:MAG: SCP2 sterol-binding domain-containing protein [archaeon]|nr:SCP2 sterol-binding domain-containing protein [archaeon]
MTLENEDLKEAMEDMDITIATVIKDKDAKLWIKVKDGVFSHGTGDVDSPTFTMTADLKIISGMMMGEVDSTSAYMAGDITVDGHLQSAMAFQEVIDLAMEAFEDMVDDL